MIEVKDLSLESLRPGYLIEGRFDAVSIMELSGSIKSRGLLEPIAVRPYLPGGGVYQIIYGHRRVAAIKSLGLKYVRAEIHENVDDSTMLQMALIENLQRKDMSDYEKGLLFERLSTVCKLTYEAIGQLVGKTKQYISNHIAMTNLFSNDELIVDHELSTLVQQITEAHARILLKVSDHGERDSFLRKTVEEHLCTRELRSLVARNRGDRNFERVPGVEWASDNIRNKSDNSENLGSKHGRVCVFRADSANFLISKLKISPHQAGEEIGNSAAKMLLDRGINPKDQNNWSRVLVEKNKYAGWGKFSTTTDEKLVVHDPSLNAEFLRGYFEAIMGVKLRCIQNKSKVQIFEILSRKIKIASSQKVRNL